jgi:hypothetical protein
VKKEKDDVKRREASRKEELQVDAGEAAALLALLAQKAQILTQKSCSVCKRSSRSGKRRRWSKRQRLQG